MATYRAPIREMNFVMNDVLNFAEISQIPRFIEAGIEFENMPEVLEEASKMIEKEIAPLNHTGDHTGCTWTPDGVKTPAGFKAAYEKYWQAGWLSLPLATEYGGQGFPFSYGKPLEEMLCTANMSFCLYAGLTQSAFESIEEIGTEHQRHTYLPKMGSGEWTGTMCLTEPQAGTDLGAVRTKAIPQADGSFKLVGSKIFITGGDHDLADNTIHYVLARIEGAPAGVKGLSTFIVPKFIVNADGSLGARNPVTCSAIEHKMGIRGSATCVMQFDEAVGEIIGKPNEGIMNMFKMMNLARIMVGFQGLACAELAYQNALNYAKDRKQGKTTQGNTAIVDHADVRRMLLTVKSQLESGRVMAYEIAKNVDLMRHHPDAQVRKEATMWVELVTPIVKAYLTDFGVEAASTAIQVYGGHGFIEEHGVAQIYRDAKIACLYEGTNGVQSMDLVRRKLVIFNGELPKLFFSRVKAWLNNAGENTAFINGALATAVDQLETATTWIQNSLNTDFDAAGSGAVEYLRAFGIVMLAWNHGRLVEAAAKLPADAFTRGKRQAADFFVAKFLPQVPALLAAAQAGSAVVMNAEVDGL